VNAINTENLTKTYQNGVNALNGISLTVKRGEIFTLLGQNGAGKSTLINILTTYLPPTGGHAVMLDHDLDQDAAAIRARIACVAQRLSIDTHLSLTENMMFQSKLYKIPKTEAIRRMNTLITAFELERYVKYPVATYSGGVKRRLDIALNMMSDPDILFLDEPTVGMDIQSRLAMWKMMQQIRADFGTTVFLTTHYLEEADQLSDTVCIMKDGKEIVQGSPHALRKYLKQDSLEISFTAKDPARDFFRSQADPLLDSQPELRGSKVILNISGNSPDEFERTNRYLLEHRIPFTGIAIIQPTLEDIFIRLTGSPEQNAADSSAASPAKEVAS